MTETTHIYKVVTAGDGGVGKTTMLYRYIDGQFTVDTKMTIGTNVFNKIVSLKDGKVVKLQIWDFGGQERFRFLLPEFVRGATGAFLMYDLTSWHSFNSLLEWKDMVRKYDPKLPVLLLGTKYDLEEEIIVDDESAHEFVEKHKLNGFYKTSSKTGHNINEVFDMLAEILVEYKL